MNSAKKVHPSKRDVVAIGDDDSTKEQPVTKSVKREEEELQPVSSSKVVELEQKVLKLEDMFQRACRAARTAELRAEAAEERLDAKYGIKEGFQSEKKRADELARENEALKREMDDMRKKHQEERLDAQCGIREGFDAEKKRADDLEGTVSKLNRENGDLKTELAGRADCELQKRVDELTKKLAQQEHKGKISHLLASADLTEKLLDLVKKARGCGQLKFGDKYAAPAINGGTAELIIFAADVADWQTIRRLSALCDEKNVPYVFVESVEEVLRAAGLIRRFAVFEITRNDGSQLETLIRDIKKDVQKLL